MVQRILVAIDGSDASTGVLRWAVEEARCHDAALTAMLVFTLASLSGRETSESKRSDLQAESMDRLDAIVDDVVGDDPSVDIRRTVKDGDPRQVLREHSADADLLVVGSRGHGEVAGLLLGSVGQYLVTHASCPVTVVRQEPARRRT